jgi:hypothetical protein
MDAIGLNYALESAVADLVDNSVDAKAEKVLIRFVRDGSKVMTLVVVDDGIGMDDQTIDLAMTIGGDKDYEFRYGAQSRIARPGEEPYGLFASEGTRGRWPALASTEGDAELRMRRRRIRVCRRRARPRLESRHSFNGDHRPMGRRKGLPAVE